MEANEWAEERGMSFGTQKHEIVRMGRSEGTETAMWTNAKGERIVLGIQKGFEMEVLGTYLGGNGVSVTRQLEKVGDVAKRQVGALKWMRGAGRIRHVGIQGRPYQYWVTAAVKAHSVLIPVNETTKRGMARTQRELATWSIGLQGEERKEQTLELARMLG
jgi:hypothetical protein